MNLIRILLACVLLAAPSAEGARTFNGSSQYISAASIPGSVGDNPRTVAFWVRTTTATTRQFFYSEGDETGSYTRFAVEITAAGRASFNIRSTGYDGATTLSANTWYHIAVTYNNTAYRLYVNGVSDVNGTSPTLNTSGSGFNIGRFYGASLYLSGEMAEVAKWNIDLNAAEVAALAKGRSPLGVRPSSLAFYAPLVREVIDFKGLALTDNSTGVSDHVRRYD